MGNISFIVPTKKLEDFNIDKVFELLSEEFNDLTIERSDEFKELQVRTSRDNLVTDIYFNQDCYILNYEDDIKELEEMIKEVKETKYPELERRYLDCINGLKKLQEINPDLDNVIQLTYGSGREVELKQDIEYFLQDYFYAYNFDEGIHPEYIGPDYERKPKSNIISNWKDFFKN